MNDNLEQLWEQLLSRQPEQIRTVYAGLAPADQQAVCRHLERMAGEPGWHVEQRLSAQAALVALREEASADGTA